MLTQAIPVVGAQVPFVYTGHGKKIFNQTALNKETPVDGKVTVITDEFMKVESKNGESTIIHKPDTYNTANHTTNFYSPSVRVGDKVKSGQTVYECSSFKSQELALGVPLLTAFTSYYAREHEDGMVLSESAAEKFGAKLMVEVTVPMTKDTGWVLGHDVFDNIPEANSDNYDELGLIKVGTPVTKLDYLFVYWELLDPRRSEKARIQLALDKNSAPKQLKGIQVPFKVRNGVVSKIYFKPVRGYEQYLNRADFSQLATHFANENRKFRSREAQALGVNINELKDYKVKPVSFPYDEQIGEIVFEITYMNPLKVSDKMANEFGHFFDQTKIA